MKATDDRLRPCSSSKLASVHCRVPTAQSAIHPMLVRARTRLNPQSAVRKTQHRFGRSNLDLRGPRNGLEIGPPNS
eukprot:664237-Alexandrium_andersonii.AAC.1